MPNDLIALPAACTPCNFGSYRWDSQQQQLWMMSTDQGAWQRAPELLVPVPTEPLLLTLAAPLYMHVSHL